MAPKRRKRPSFSAGPGVLIFPFLNRARDYQNNGKFAYSCGLRLAAEEELERLRSFVEGEGKEACRARFPKETAPTKASPLGRFKQDANAWPFRTFLPGEDDEGEEFEYVAFKANTPRTLKDGRTIDCQPRFFDADLKPIPAADVPLIGAGTRACIGFQLYAWNTNGVGLTFVPIAVQILELVEYKPGFADPEEAGLSRRDGGYRAPAPRSVASASDADEGEAGDGVTSASEF